MLYQAIKLHRAEHAARTTIHVWKVNMIRPAFRHWCAMYIVRLMLHRMPLFSELSNEVIDSLAECVHTESFEKKEVLCQQGEVADKFFLIIEGLAQPKVIRDGFEITLPLLDFGATFGAQALCMGVPHPRTITGIDEVTCYVIDSMLFVSLLGKEAMLRDVFDKEVAEAAAAAEEVIQTDLREKRLSSEQRTKMKADALGSKFVIPDPSHHMLGFFESGHVEEEKDSDLQAKLYAVLAEEAREFAAMDRNGDGVLDRDEVMAAAHTFYMTPEEASELFDRLDANGDGVLQPEEWHEAASEAGEIARRRKFQAMDKDGNGVLDRQEVMAVAGDFNMTEMEASALFNRIDANGDGTIDMDEWFEAASTVDRHEGGAEQKPVVEITLQIVRSRMQVSRGEGDILIKIEPNHTVLELKERIHQKQKDFRSPDAVIPSCQALFLFQSKDPRMDRLVGYEFDDRREMREYGIDGRSVFNAKTNNVEEIAAVLLLIDHFKLPHYQQKRYLECHRRHTQCFQS